MEIAEKLVVNPAVGVRSASGLEEDTELGAHGLVVRSTRDERDGRTVDDGNPRLSMTRAGATDRVVEERAADPKVIR